MSDTETPQPSILENFRTEFVQALKSPHTDEALQTDESLLAAERLRTTTNAVQIMIDAIWKNPGMLKEITEAASTALRAAAAAEKNP